MDKEVILKNLKANLESMSDEEFIQHLKDSGIEVLNYTPGELGSVILWD